jgi:hypothetical protein
MLLIFIGLWFVSSAFASEYNAISLKRASEVLQSGDAKAKQQAMTLAGITRPRVLIYDIKHKDLILVGERDSMLPSLTLDDWAVAVRSEFVVGRDPVVSIDQTPETLKTGKQVVRFEGALKDTQFGADMLAADIILKQLGLGKVSAEIFGVSSFLDLSAVAYKEKPTEQSDFTRFWFLPMRSESYVFARNGIVIVEEYKIDVQNQRYIDGKDTKNTDPAVSGFAQGVRTSFGDLKTRFPSLARMEQLYYVTALVQGLRVLGLEKSDPTVGYWLDKHQMRHVATRSTYPLEENSTNVTLESGKEAKILLSGGIDLDAMIVSLEDGVPDALKEYILASRPAQASLSWEVPLVSLSWAYDIDHRTVESAKKKLQSKPDLGMAIYRQAALFQHGRSVALQPTAAHIPKTDFHFPTSNSLLTHRYDSRLRRVSPEVGGVLLEGAAQMNAEGGQPATALATGNFTLILGDRDSRIHPQVFRRFVTSLWSVYFGNTDPGISIDPIAPGAKEQLVRYIGRIQNMDLARIMRDADYTMKKWAVGTERPEIEGFMSPDEYAAKRGVVYLNSMSRFWFVPQGMKFRSTGNALIFQDGRMTVQTEFLRNNARGLQADPANEDFARWFTEFYKEVAKRYPVYEELFEYSKLVSLANFLKNGNIPLLWYLIAHRKLVLTEESPGTVAALQEDSKAFKNVRIEGGVQLVSQPQYILDSKARTAIAKAYATQAVLPHPTQNKKPRQTLQQTVSVAVGQDLLTFAPQHSLSSGVDYKGVRYQTDLSINEQGLILTDRSLQSLSPQIHRYYLWETMRPIVIDMLEKTQGKTASEEFNRKYADTWKQAEQQTDRILRLLQQVKNKKYSDERSFRNDLEFIFEGDEYARVREIIESHAHFKTQFDLVRYYAPSTSDQETEFGPGWRLLIPYRLHFSDERVPFGRFLLPKQVTLIDLLHGEREIFSFREDNPSGAIVYFPVETSQSLVLGIAVMTDGTWWLEDKLGASFHFDSDGRMTEMALSNSHRMSFTYKPLTTFDVTPYRLDSVTQSEKTRIAGGAVVVPKQLQITDAFERQTVFEFVEGSENVVWAPRDKNTHGTFVRIAMMTNGSFQLRDRFGNVTVFDRGGRFQAVIPSQNTHYVSELGFGDQRLTFRYMINREGRLCVDEIWAYMDTASGSPNYVVDYRYDEGLQLANRQVQFADGRPVHWQEN